MSVKCSADGGSASCGVRLTLVLLMTLVRTLSQHWTPSSDDPNLQSAVLINISTRDRLTEEDIETFECEAFPARCSSLAPRYVLDVTSSCGHWVFPVLRHSVWHVIQTGSGHK